MAGKGPAPKDPSQRRRRNKTATRALLPAEGRTGETPVWPLPEDDRIGDAELSLWADLWRLPQAVVWERLGYFREVALYVRHQILAEFGSLDHAKEARMRSDRLGLTPDSMRRLQWEVVEDEVGERRQEKASSRPKLRAVDPG